MRDDCWKWWILSKHAWWMLTRKSEGSGLGILRNFARGPSMCIRSLEGLVGGLGAKLFCPEGVFAARRRWGQLTKGSFADVKTFQQEHVRIWSSLILSKHLLDSDISDLTATRLGNKDCDLFCAHHNSQPIFISSQLQLQEMSCRTITPNEAAGWMGGWTTMRLCSYATQHYSSSLWWHLLRWQWALCWVHMERPWNGRRPVTCHTCAAWKHIRCRWILWGGEFGASSKFGGLQCHTGNIYNLKFWCHA